MIRHVAAVVIVVAAYAMRDSFFEFIADLIYPHFISPHASLGPACYSLPLVAGLERACMSYNVSSLRGQSYNGLAVIGYVPKYDGPMGVSIFVRGTKQDNDVPENYVFTEAMARRNSCAFSVEFARPNLVHYCEGDFDTKAIHIFGPSKDSALSRIEQAFPQCRQDAGVTIVGFSQGSHIALHSRESNSNVRKILLLGSGTSPISSLAWCPFWRSDMYHHGTHLFEKERILSVVGERDVVFGGTFGGLLNIDVRTQQKLLTGYSDCEDKYVCIRSDGSGYVIVKNGKHNFHINERNEEAHYMTHEFLFGGAEYALPRMLHWLLASANADS